MKLRRVRTLPTCDSSAASVASGLAIVLSRAMAGVIVLAVGAYVDAFAAFVLLPLVIGACTVQFFLGFESYYRFVCDRTDAMGNKLVSVAWYSRYFHQNSLGLRDNVDYAMPLTPGRRNMTKIRGGRLLFVTFPYMDVPWRFKSAHEQLNRYWAEHGVPHLDLLPVFSNLPPDRLVVNPHDAHPNEYARALAAEAIDAFLRREMSEQPKEEEQSP